jgi:hypothetical protein
MADWSDLGSLIGGGAGGMQAFQAGQLNTAQTQQALAAARGARANASIKEDEEQQRQKLGDAFAAMGIDHPYEKAALIRSGAANYEGMTKGEGERQTQGFRSTVADVNTPLPVAQRALAAAGQPLIEPIKAVGAGGYTDITAEHPSVETTPLGAAMIGHTEAQTALEQAKAAHPELFKSSLYGNLTDQQIQDQIDMAAKGQIQAPTGRMAQTASGAKILSGLHAKNPEFSATAFPTAQAAEKAFTSGPPSVKIRSLNAAVAHLGTLEQLGDALNNGDMQRFNQIANFLSKETGHPAPTNFEAARDLVGQEIVSAIVPTGASQAERQTAQQQFMSRASPQQIHGTADTYRTLLGGQFDALKQQYQATPGYANKTDFESRFMLPKTLAALGRGPQVSGSSTPTFKTEAEAEAAGLKPGTRVIIGGVSGTWH